MINCPNCAAPIESDICPYCGSVFLDWASFDMKRPTFVKIFDGNGNLNLMKIKPVSAGIKYETDDPVFYYDNERLHSIHTSPTLKIEAEFEAIPFKLKTFDKDSILRLLIKPDIVDTDTVRDILKETRNG
jgi:hypothetical protein